MSVVAGLISGVLLGSDGLVLAKTIVAVFPFN